MSELRLVIPMLPPSGNHYKTYRVVVPKHGGKPFVQWYLTEEAEAWMAAVAVIAAGQQIRGPALELQYIVFFPDHRRRDTANFEKCIGDSLTKCGAIEDDSFITDTHGHKRIDAANPRTIIVVKTDQESLL